MRALLAVLLCLGLASPAAAVEVSLVGPWQQGGLIVGTTAPGARVLLDGAPLPVAAGGRFLIGLDRDAPAQVTLRVEGPDGSVAEQRFGVLQRDYQVQRIDGLPQEQVTPPEELLERLAAEREKVVAARLTETAEPYWESGYDWPVEGRITGVFGSQRILNGEPRNPHYGLDIAAPTGTPVQAPADGVVVLAESDLFYQGGMIVIDHGLGLHSNLMHLSSLAVTPGELVTKGQVVGAVGATGRVTGAHLDWRVNHFSAWVDPALLLSPAD